MFIISMRQKEDLSGEVNPIVDNYKTCRTTEGKHLYKEQLRHRIKVNREALKKIKEIEK